jgi:DNA-binding NarL/FixJ family response regulator
MPKPSSSSLVPLPTDRKIKIACCDDHVLFVKAIVGFIHEFSDYEVILETYSGEQLLKKLPLLKERPDILLLDICMPVMDGYQTAEQVHKQYPDIKIIALSMYT